MKFLLQAMYSIRFIFRRQVSHDLLRSYSLEKVKLAVWRRPSADIISHINEVTLRRAQLVLQAGKPPGHATSQLDQLSPTSLRGH